MRGGREDVDLPIGMSSVCPSSAPFLSAGINPARTSEDLPLPDAPMMTDRNSHPVNDPLILPSVFRAQRINPSLPHRKIASL